MLVHVEKMKEIWVGWWNKERKGKFSEYYQCGVSLFREIEYIKITNGN